ncbi:MAG: hypothetical protein US63_C0016G0012 [Candidatus Moranbacteria bacterium GW2011_GWC2_37_8]|nr:MAG: hypothetical protein US63_C0016G0012 [Candidatus Moranbacteria bacterium GW2011_GWC2_37_8]KKQ62493.1 MAG: hypothetical protein US82_C0010G0013 [Parcubacteria group bacterium GW2011_GWC1_38_22]KKQ81071.1 MAG: hypothetical protein UT03_C0013G0003 [Candidatus Moranbacteria bacterium GW2011_GWD2_38_7]
MREIISTFSDFILDTLFPIRCLQCKKEGNWICRACASNIHIQTEHVCPICERSTTPNGKTCLDCKKKSALDGIIPATNYQDPTVSKAIHHFKYRFIADLHVELGGLLISALQKSDTPIPDIIIPIPLHTRRLRWRGFNQSFLLASQVAQKLLPAIEIKLEENILIRKRYTCPQMEIKDYQSRKQNLAGAFHCSDANAVKNKIILLIDDVATTGSTIFECAKVLKKAGAKEVYAAVIARQEVGGRE